MAKGMKHNLTDMEVTGAGAVNQGGSRLNKPIAREHQAHVSIANETKEYTTGKPSHGKLGGRSHAGK